MRRLILICLLATPIAASADDGMQRHDRHAPLQRGAQAPAFGPLQVINSAEAKATTVTFSGQPAGKEHVWVLALFAAWCPGCVNEMPMLRKLDDAYRSRGVRIVSISEDREASAASRVAAVLASAKARHPVANDADEEVLKKYAGGNLSLPFLFVIGPDGSIAQTHEGYDEGTEASLRSAIDGLLTANAAAR